MLEDVLKSCESSPECTIIFCDEMSSVVKSLDHSFLEDLSEKITTWFQVHLEIHLWQSQVENKHYSILIWLNSISSLTTIL